MAVEPQAPPAAGDPSMEDILASIRRILNEDEQPPEATPAPAAPPAAAPATAPATAGPAPTPAPATRAETATPSPDAESLLALTEDMIVEEPAAPIAAPPRPEPGPVALPVSEALLAPAASAAAAASVGQLLRAVAAERSSAVHRGGPTIEDVVREEIRPLLKDWLDQFLPPLVERLVQAEIERVVGRAVR